MMRTSIFLYEWKHFIRNPFKVVAILLFVIAAAYGLRNGAQLHDDQLAEIQRIKIKAEEGRQTQLAFYDEGKQGPEGRPWVNVKEPFWAIWYSGIHHFKTPSPAMVYSIGQAEQYGFYKDVDFLASPYDADMTKEISNPERLQMGSLDFSFAILFLLPLLLLILLYNIKSAESEQGILSLIDVQVQSENSWILARIAFYVAVMVIVLLGLTLYGALLTGVFESSSDAFLQILALSLIYLLFWAVIYFFIIKSGGSIIGNTLKLVGAWILLAFILPAIVHQWVSFSHPTNLMIDFIDSKRDQQQELYDQPDSILLAQSFALYPEAVNSPATRDSLKKVYAMNFSVMGLVNEMVKTNTAPIRSEIKEKNAFIERCHWINPVGFFQNQFNRVSKTHFDDYQTYRSEIQSMIDLQLNVMVIDSWNDVEVDKEKYLSYIEKLQL